MFRAFLPSTTSFAPLSVAGWRQLTVSAILGVTLAACAGVGGVSKDSPDDIKVAAVTRQVNARYQALVAGDVQKSYDFLSSGSKATTSLDLYRAKARVSGVRKGEVEKVECGQETCKVSVRVTIDTSRMKGLPLPVTETWILEGGEYRFVFLL